MNRLWLRLLLSFALVTIVGVLGVALLAERQLDLQFRHFMGNAEMHSSPLPEQLEQYYGEHGGWQGVEQLMATTHTPGGRGMGPGMHRGGANALLSDSDGVVRYASAGEGLGRRLSSQQIDEAIVLEWQGQLVGYLLVSTPIQGELSLAAQQFLDQLNRTLLQAGLIAGGVGLLLGVLITRWLAAPLRRLVAAAQGVAHGRLDHRVPETGPREISSLATAFNEMAASLEQSEQLRRAMVADIAHELRTPLSVLRGNLQAILDDVYPLEKAEIAQLYDETMVLSRLVGDLHDLAQAEAKQLPLAREAMGLGTVVTHVGTLFGELAAERQIAVAVEVPEGLPPVYADPQRVRQVLHNLLANALRYTSPGGTIRLAVDRPQGQSALRVVVEDSGSGIAASDLPHVFDRLWRAEGSRSREHGGSGLGLAIAKQLVEAQGGQIGAESQPGQGSRFWLTLPLMA